MSALESLKPWDCSPTNSPAFTATYVLGRGYTVRNSRGLIVAHSLSKSAADALVSTAGLAVLSSSLLQAITAG